MIHKDTFDFHVDAKHFNYMWASSMYITVSYTAWQKDGKIRFSLDDMKAPPYLIGSIVLNGSWWDVDVQMIEAAQDHAEKHFNNTVHPIITSALAPFITH